MLPPRDDNLNVYDRVPERTATLSAALAAGPAFSARDAALEPLRRDLIAALPHAGALRDDTTFGGGSGGAPWAGWLRAVDYLVVRDTHGMALPPGARALLAPAAEFVTWRFAAWLTHPPLAALAGAPLLRELADEVAAAAARHDVTAVATRREADITARNDGEALGDDGAEHADCTGTTGVGSELLVLAAHDVKTLTLRYDRPFWWLLVSLRESILLLHPHAPRTLPSLLFAQGDHPCSLPCARLGQRRARRLVAIVRLRARDRPDAAPPCRRRRRCVRRAHDA